VLAQLVAIAASSVVMKLQVARTSACEWIMASTARPVIARIQRRAGTERSARIRFCLLILVHVPCEETTRPPSAFLRNRGRDAVVGSSWHIIHSLVPVVSAWCERGGGGGRLLGSCRAREHSSCGSRNILAMTCALFDDGRVPPHVLPPLP
jgi:hypothetical protein